MNKIRRGKDFKVIWSFFDCDGKPYLLEREFLTMYAVNSFCTFEVTDFTVDGNTVIWLFRGKDQKNLGDYTLELVKNNGEEGMIPIETVDAFTLVQYTRDEARCDCGNVKVEDVTINSSLDIDTIASLSIDTALSTTSNNAIANFVVTRELNKKQDNIDDLATIRSGAAKGATAVQNVISSNTNYAAVSREGFELIIAPKTKKISEAGDPVDHLSGIADAYDAKQELAKKVDKVSGKQLSTEDFTTALKQKLQSLNNYDDTVLTSAINSLQSQINTLVSGNASSAIDTFNEIIAFLDGVKDTQDLAGIIASIEQQIAGVNSALSAELAKKPNKTDMATVNGQSLTNGGNIVIDYDDTELREGVERNKGMIASLAGDVMDNLEKITQQEQQLTELSAKVSEAVGKKADEQGYYPNLSVGMADNLLGHAPAVEREIVFDATASKDNDVTEDVARIEAIKGNSVVWNQRINRTYKTTTHNGVTFTVNSDGSVTANGTSDAAASLSYLAVLRNPVFTSHKYFVYGGASGGSAKTYYFGDGNNLNCYDSAPIITNALKDATTVTFAFRVAAGVSVENITFPAPIVIDLTQMFGAGNEPTTIAEFYSRIPSGVDINAYNEGEVIHNYATGLKSVGFNAWDEQWLNGYYANGKLTKGGDFVAGANYIRVIAGQTYNFSTLSTNTFYVSHYDADFNYIDSVDGLDEYGRKVVGKNGNYTIPQGVSYITIFLSSNYGKTYNHDICIHLAHTGYRNGEYAPYWEESIGLPNTLVFADGMKSAGSVRDEIYYDRYAKKWRVMKWYVFDGLGDLNWNYYADYGFYAPLSKDAMWGTDSFITKLPYDKKIRPTSGELKSLDKVIMLGVPNIGDSWAKKIVIKDTAYTDVATFKAAMKDIPLYYALSEPIESDLDDYLPATMSAEERAKVLQFIYRVSDFGTEQMLTDEGVKSSALVADIVYGVDAFRTLVNLRKRVAALEK